MPINVSHVPRIIQPYIRFLGPKVCPLAGSHTDRQTDSHTDKVTTEDTLSGFQEFFLQPIIMDQSKNN